ncbi:MAG: aldehyde dehydrogenase family protein, partial [Trueperaceae bacterium]
MKMLLADGWVQRDARTEVIDPEDGSVVGTVPRADAADMEGAISAAVQGAETAAKLPVHARMRLLN